MKTLITFLSGMVAVLLTGMLFYRFDIFNIHSPNFQFISAGLTASILYPVSLYRERRDVLYISILLVFLHFIFFRPPQIQIIVRDLVYLTAIISAIVVYVFVILPLILKYKILRVLALPFVFGIFYIAAALILAFESYLFFDTLIPDLPGMILWFLKYGAIIGFGLSIGFNFAEFIIKNYFSNHHPISH